MDNQEATVNQADQETMEHLDLQPQAQVKDLHAFQNVQLDHPDQQEIQAVKDRPETQELQAKACKEEAKAHQDHQDLQDHQDKPETTANQASQEHQVKCMTAHKRRDHQDQQDQAANLDPQVPAEKTAVRAIQADKDHQEMPVVKEATDSQAEMESLDLLARAAEREDATIVLHPEQLPAIKRHIMHGIHDFSTEFMAFYCIPLLFIKNVYSPQIT